MSDQDDRTIQRTMVYLLLGIALAGAVDLAFDRPSSWLTFHVLYEVALIVAALAMAVALVRRWRLAEAASRELRRRLAERQAERDAWRASAEQALAGFGAAVDAQFSAWQFTPSEREVALLVLKGLGHKEIAAQTGRSERTVRQHAASAYEKAGLGGRAELAAFFLEGVALPAAREGTPEA